MFYFSLSYFRLPRFKREREIVLLIFYCFEGRERMFESLKIKGQLSWKISLSFYEQNKYITVA